MDPGRKQEFCGTPFLLYNGLLFDFIYRCNVALISFLTQLSTILDPSALLFAHARLRGELWGTQH